MPEAAAQSRPGGTVAIVTGGTRDLGREIVLELTGRGCAVVVVYLRDPIAAEAVVERATSAGGPALAVRADLTDALDVERLFDETILAFGVVDVLVHAARPEAAELLRQAQRRLRRGGAVLIFSNGDLVAPALAEALRASGVAVFELAHGREPGGHRHEVEGLIALLCPWLEGRAG